MSRTKRTKAVIAAETNEVIGRWRVDSVVDGSTRQVNVTCLECGDVAVRCIYDLTRTRRGLGQRCKKCANKLIIEGNRLSPGEALLKNLYSEYRKGARVRGIDWSINFNYFRSLVRGDCFYCGAAPNRVIESAWDSLSVNGIDRVDNNNYYRPGNIVTCCKDCNYAKRKLSQQEFINLCERVADRARSHNRSSQ
jgi:hypothetical protein